MGRGRQRRIPAQGELGLLASGTRGGGEAYHVLRLDNMALLLKAELVGPALAGHIAYAFPGACQQDTDGVVTRVMFGATGGAAELP